MRVYEHKESKEVKIIAIFIIIVFIIFAIITITSPTNEDSNKWIIDCGGKSVLKAECIEIAKRYTQFNFGHVEFMFLSTAKISDKDETVYILGTFNKYNREYKYNAIIRYIDSELKITYYKILE